MQAAAGGSKKRAQGEDASKAGSQSDLDVGEEEGEGEGSIAEDEDGIEGDEASDDDNCDKARRPMARGTPTDVGMVTPKSKVNISKVASPGALVEPDLYWHGPGGKQFKIMSPGAKISMINECVASDDGKSVAVTSVASGASDRPGGKNNTPTYWIQKMPAQMSLLTAIDKHNIVQANKCIDREMKPGKDQASAKQLKQHTGLLSFCQSLLPERIPDNTDDEIETALVRITEAGLAIPPNACLGILSRTISRDITLLKGAFSSLNRLRLFHNSPDELIFDCNNPMFVSLLSVVPFSTMRARWTTWCSSRSWPP